MLAKTRFATLIALLVMAACSDTNPAGPIPVASVSVTPPAQSVMVGTPVTLTAKPKDAEGEDLERDVMWTSENELLATVSSAGVVTPVAVGEVGIRATAGGRFGRAVLTITPVPVAEVRLSADDEIILAWDGETQISAMALDAQGNMLSGRTVTWQSNRTNVVAVNHGHLYAINPGTATITATIEGQVASVGVRVTEVPATALRIIGPTNVLELNDVLPFAAEITFANGQVLYGPATWTSSNASVVKIDHADFSGATLAALAEGEATITISRDGIQASKTLTVYPRPTHDLIYNRWEDVQSRIMHLSLVTDGLTPATLNAGAVSRDPSPSPDGTQFVFAVSQVSTLGEAQNDLYIVNKNGLNMRRLTSMPGIEDSPQWSPDGTKVLFHATVDNRSDLYTINVDGTGMTNLTAGLPADVTYPGTPAWSPNGSKVAFIAVRNLQHKVWTINVDGSALTQVTTDAGFDLTPTFSPDGQKIAFTRYNAANASLGDDIMIVSATGGTPTRIALPGDQRTPAWSPEGTLIAFTGNAIAGQAQTYIYTMRPDGSGVRVRTVNPAWHGSANPAWIKR
jgi:Tol biopolymer transport system component